MFGDENIKIKVIKCEGCNKWHVFLVAVISDNILIHLSTLATFTNWWDEVLVAINFPEMVS